MPTLNSNLLPNESGLDLGSPDQMWDGFFNELTVSGVITANGNATELQGTPICTTPPGPGNILLSDGTQWCPSATISATQLQGIPIAVGPPPVLNDLLTFDGFQWTPAAGGGGGGGASLGYVIVPFVATPNFTPVPVGACAFAMTLTGNVTSSVFNSGGVGAGALFNFILTQNGAGLHTFAWPANTKGGQPIAGGANLTTVQAFIWDGVNLIPNASPVVFL